MTKHIKDVWYSHICPACGHITSVSLKKPKVNSIETIRDYLIKDISGLSEEKTHKAYKMIRKLIAGVLK